MTSFTTGRTTDGPTTANGAYLAFTWQTSNESVVQKLRDFALHIIIDVLTNKMPSGINHITSRHIAKCTGTH